MKRYLWVAWIQASQFSDNSYPILLIEAISFFWNFPKGKGVLYHFPDFWMLSMNNDWVDIHVSLPGSMKKDCKNRLLVYIDSHYPFLIYLLQSARWSIVQALNKWDYGKSGNKKGKIGWCSLFHDTPEVVVDLYEVGKRNSNAATNNAQITYTQKLLSSQGCKSVKAVGP